MVESLLVTSAGLPWSFQKSFLEQLLCGESADDSLCKKELHERRYLRNFLEF